MLVLELGAWNRTARTRLFMLMKAKLPKVEVRTASHLLQRRAPWFISTPCFPPRTKVAGFVLHKQWRAHEIVKRDFPGKRGSWSSLKLSSLRQSLAEGRDRQCMDEAIFWMILDGFSKRQTFLGAFQDGSCAKLDPIKTLPTFVCASKQEKAGEQSVSPCIVCRHASRPACRVGYFPCIPLHIRQRLENDRT